MVHSASVLAFYTPDEPDPEKCLSEILFLESVHGRGMRRCQSYGEKQLSHLWQNEETDIALHLRCRVSFEMDLTELLYPIVRLKYYRAMTTKS